MMKKIQKLQSTKNAIQVLEIVFVFSLWEAEPEKFCYQENDL